MTTYDSVSSGLSSPITDSSDFDDTYYSVGPFDGNSSKSKSDMYKIYSVLLFKTNTGPYENNKLTIMTILKDITFETMWTSVVKIT